MREMKDSGVEWLEDIPSHWKVMPNKRIMKKKKDTCPSYQGEDILSLTMNGVIVRDLTAGGKMPATFDGYQRLTAGNLLMCLFDIDVTPRCIGLIKNDGLSSPAYSQFVLNEKGYAPYYYYYYLNLDHTKELLHMAKNLRHSLTEDQLGEIGVAVPPYVEQIQIVEALEEKLPKVNTLIANVQAQIEKLKAYKQSLITEVVTKGLDPTMPMKDSGAEWIGEIPAHWEVSRIGRHADIILGKMLCSTQLSPDHTLEPYYCAANIHFDGVDLSIRKQMWFNDIEKQQYLVRKGDLLVVEGGAGAGGCAIIQNAETPMYVQNSIMILRQPSAFDVRYFRYLLESLAKRGYVDLVCNKATIPHFTKDKLSSVPYPVLPTQEQRQISDYLDEKCIQIDQLIAIKQKKIDNLTEYKKSLIYEYVTGKKEA